VSTEQCVRGRNLQEALLRQRISKYNLGGQARDIFAGATPGQRRILVTGQVDSDASLRYGSPEVFRNIDLLCRVRQWLDSEKIDAHVVYKPHPDVIQAGRQGHVAASEALKFADSIVTDVDIFDCLTQCDELHVMTSQAGFEALLQDKTVHCWGMPFYAGWGLTQDHMICDRRQRHRNLAELVYLALCEYPRYVHWQTRRFTTPERVVAELARQRLLSGGQHQNSGWLGRKRRKVQFLLEAIRT
nr:capsular polysaccharide biosynthesis protein [Endozoicomonas sp.]